MFDIGSSELLLTIVVAIVVIGPKELPRALYKLGQVIGKARGMARHFRTGFDAMIREAELEELQKQWAAQNQKIMDDTRIPDFDSSARASTDGSVDAPSHDAEAGAGVAPVQASVDQAFPSEAEAFEVPSAEAALSQSVPAEPVAAQSQAVEAPPPQTVIPDSVADKALIDSILTGNVPATPSTTHQPSAPGQASLPLDAPSESKGSKSE